MKILLFTLSLIVLQNQSFCRSINTKNKTFILFLKFEKRLNYIRLQNNVNGKFLSPVDEAIKFQKILKTEFPQLLDSLKNNYQYFVYVLSDTSFKKNKNFNYDIIKLFYNLCFEKYLEVLNKVCEEYFLGKLKMDILLNFIITYDGHFTNILVDEYKDANLNTLLTKLRQSYKFIKDLDKNDKYIKIIDAIQTGYLYKIFSSDEKD